MACKRDGSLIFRALFFLLLLVPEVALSADSTELIDFTRHWAGFLCLGIFFVAYSLVILEEKIHLQQILADKKDISIHAEFEDVAEFLFDANRMGQVVDNLLSNAVKYSPLGKNIYVKLSCENDKVKLSVRDEGPGISHEERGKLFQHFQKLSARPTGGESSSGLGLAIAQRIVEEHGGSIGVESEPGQGANFHFELPDVRNPA